VPRSLALLLFCTLAAGCAPYLVPPCYPASSATPVPESEGGFAPKTLAWEIDKMAALVDVPESDDPPSAVFLGAQRDMRTEFWPDAAKGFLAVVRGDTNDGKVIRLHAQYDFAFALFRMRYFDDAKRIFRMIAADPKHPMNAQATEWMNRKICTG
jgi:hypothetical protein